MNSRMVYVFVAVLLVLLLTSVRFGYLAATASDSKRKGQSRLIATLTFAAWFLVWPGLMISNDRSVPTLAFQGKIQAVHVLNGNSRHYSATLQLHTTTGSDLLLHASDPSLFFRPGEAIQVRYRADTGELVGASFYGLDGKREGVFNSFQTVRYYLSIGLAVFLMWTAFRRYIRDPDGTES